MAKRCPGCMKLKEKSPVCEHCGYNEHVPNESHQLPIGTVLQGRYQIGKVLGQGGFGITYIGWDMSLETTVAIKEYYPSSFVNRDCAQNMTVSCNRSNVAELFVLNRERFLREARLLAKLSHVPGIVRVQNLFAENNTAYIVMEYVEGIDLKRYIRMQGRTLTVEETFAVMRPIMYALSKVHDAELVHRDISPDNIMIQNDGSVILLDFGAARQVENADVHKDLPQSTESILKHGFAPIEQYRRRGNLGPWTDIYALCATMYYCLTGSVPSDAPERVMGDDNVNWRQIPGLTEQQLAVLETGMAMIPEKRVQSVKELYQALFGERRTTAMPVEPKKAEPEAVPAPPVEKPAEAPVKEAAKSVGKKPVEYPSYTLNLEEQDPAPRTKEPVDPDPVVMKTKPKKKKKIVGVIAAAVLVVIVITITFFSNTDSNIHIEAKPTDTYTSPLSTFPAEQPYIDSDKETTVATIDIERDPIILGNGEILPREETLCLSGQQWGTVNSWNIIGTNQNNALAIAGGSSGYRTLMFETLCMYNPLDGSLTGLLANNDWKWNNNMTQLTLTIKDAAKWSDGTPVTATDVVRTWDISKKIGNGNYYTYNGYIESIKAEGQKVIINCSRKSNGTPTNPLKILDFLSGFPIAQSNWIDTITNRNSSSSAILNDPGEDIVWSGPYTKYYSDNQIVVLIRDDNYWGKDSSMWGKLPAPKYIAHVIYDDNAASEAALKAGDVDVCQQFISNIQDLWLEDNLPISTYYKESPYGICLTMPTAWYNMNISVISKNPEIRKAIAMAVDYDAIIANAMSNQSPSFYDVPRSLMNPTDGEQSLYNHDAVSDLQWTGNDIQGAIKLLDSVGIVDVDGDGIREFNGKEISFVAACPNGWTDWQAAINQIVIAGQRIGIDIKAEYPEYYIYQSVFTNPNQTEYGIFMWSPDAASPSNPWQRINQFMGLDYVGVNNNWSGNWGQYRNTEADALINQIPTTTDATKLNELYTELTKIYLTEVPSFSLMYRPSLFHVVNESVWTNFPANDDGRNIPPTCCTDGYGIAALYDLKLA